MEALELNADIREITGKKVKYLRQEGLVPAVLYGHAESTLLKIEAKPLQKVLSEAGTHQLVSLKIGKKKPVVTLARDIQRDVIRRDYLHVDFYAVKMDEKVTAQVPLVLTGESAGVRDLGGILSQGMDMVEIECLPTDLLSSIEVNIDGLLEFNDSIQVSGLIVPDTITLLSDPDSMVVKVEPPRLEEEEEEVDDELLAEAEGVEPEVLTAAKEKDEDEE